MRFQVRAYRSCAPAGQIPSSWRRTALIRPELYALFLITACPGCTTPEPPRAHAPGAAQPWTAPPLERAVPGRGGRTGEAIPLETPLDRPGAAGLVFPRGPHPHPPTHRIALSP